jgi:hypothetical protein
MRIFDRLAEWRMRRRYPLFDAQGEDLRPKYQRVAAALFDAMGEGGADFLDRKWRLSESKWTPERPVPRPASAQEIAGTLGVDVADVRGMDEQVLEMAAVYRKHNDYARLMFDLLAVPIDEAQSWWDRGPGRFSNPDGTPKTGWARKQAFRDHAPGG